MSQTGKSIDTESRLGVAREQGAGGVGSDREQYLLPFGDDGNVLEVKVVVFTHGAS